MLRGGRCAARAEKRNFIEGRCDNGPRIVPTRNLWSGSDSAESGRQYRSMQRLANMANRIWGAIVFVQKAATSREIEQCQAQQRRANAAHCVSGRAWTKFLHESAKKIHKSRYLDGVNLAFVAHRTSQLPLALDPRCHLT